MTLKRRNQTTLSRRLALSLATAAVIAGSSVLTTSAHDVTVEPETGVVDVADESNVAVEGPLGVEDAAVAEPALAANEIDAGQIGLGIDTAADRDIGCAEHRVYSVVMC